MVTDFDNAKETSFQAELLQNAFLNTATWRREQAVEYPDDERNLGAARILERLAETVSDIDPSVLNGFGELFEGTERVSRIAKCFERLVFTPGQKICINIRGEDDWRRITKQLPDPH